MAAFVNINEVRHYVLDRTVEDNDIDLDLSFSDEEITQAMERAARSFNSLPPLIMRVQWNRMPLDTNIFLDATAGHLYRAELGKLRRNDIDYNAGGVAVNIAAKRIGHYEKLIAEHNKAWAEPARNIKIHANLQQAYRTF